MSALRNAVAWVFSGLFLTIAFVLLGVMFYRLAGALLASKQIESVVLNAISTAVVALATFELGLGISREHRVNDDGENVYTNVRRTATRFIGVATIALVLEALMLVIKYSQLELAGNLHYPVAIMSGAGFLLISLGVFLRLTRRESAAPYRRAERPSSFPDSDMADRRSRGADDGDFPVRSVNGRA